MILFFALCVLCALGMALVPTNYGNDVNASTNEFFRYLSLDGLIQSAARAAGTVTSGHVDLGQSRASVEAKVTLSAVNTGSPTLDVDVEHSHDASTWAVLGSMTQLTNTGTETKVFAAPRRYLRFKAVTGGTGTPNITYKMEGKAF